MEEYIYGFRKPNPNYKGTKLDDVIAMNIKRQEIFISDALMAIPRL